MKRFATIAVVLSFLCALRAEAAEVQLPTDKVKLSVGGFAYGAAHFDDNGAAPRPWITVMPAARSAPVTHFEPFATRLNFTAETAAAREGEPAVNRGRAVLEFDWLPAGLNALSGPRIRLAFAQLEFKDSTTLTIGQNWSLLGAVGPDTLNFNWFLRQGNPWARAPALQLSRRFGPVTAAVAATGSSIAGFGGATAVNGAGVSGTYAVADTLAPAVEGRVQYGILGKGHVALAGGFGRVTAAHTPATGQPALRTRFANRFIGVLEVLAPIDGWGAVSGKAFYGQAGYGIGVGQPLIVDADGATPIPSKGGFLSARLTRFDPVTVALYAGIDDPDDEVDGVTLPIRRNLTVGGYAGYTVAPGALLALEVMRVTTTRTVPTTTEPEVSDFTGDRFSLIARYSF